MMTSLKSPKIFYSLLFLLLTGGLQAQTPIIRNNTNSPYSFYGIGESESQAFAYAKGLGGGGSGIFSNQHYTLLNPSSLGFLDRTVFDFGLRSDYGILTKNQNQRTYNNGNFNYFALAMPIYKSVKTVGFDTTYSETNKMTVTPITKQKFNWNAGFSVTPYASMGSDFQQQKDTSFASPLLVNISHGGLTNASMQHSLRIGSAISLGYSFGFVWGQNSDYTEMIFPDSQNIYSLVDDRKTILNAFTHQFGLGFQKNIGSKIQISGGVAYRLEQNFNAKQNRLVRSYDYNIQGVLALSDTVLFDNYKKITQQAPAYLNAGVSIKYSNLLRLNIDYAQQNWSNIKPNLSNFTLFSAGLTFRPETLPTKSLRKPELSIGYRNNTLIGRPVDLNGNFASLQETGISFGIGLPVLRDIYTQDGKRSRYRSMVHIAGEYIVRGKSTDGLIKEELYRVTVGLSLTDLWFVKRRYD